MIAGTLALVMGKKPGIYTELPQPASPGHTNIFYSEMIRWPRAWAATLRLSGVLGSLTRTTLLWSLPFKKGFNGNM